MTNTKHILFYIFKLLISLFVIGHSRKGTNCEVQNQKNLSIYYKICSQFQVSFAINNDESTKLSITYICSSGITDIIISADFIEPKTIPRSGSINKQFAQKHTKTQILCVSSAHLKK
jgi:hypothetical protein